MKPPTHGWRVGRALVSVVRAAPANALPPDVDRETFDRLVSSFQLEPGVSLYPQEDQSRLSERQRGGAVGWERRIAISWSSRSRDGTTRTGRRSGSIRLDWATT